MAPPTEGSHYFDAEPEQRSQRSTVEVNLPDVSFSCATDRGVFARTALDVGTKLLLISAPPVAEQNSTSDRSDAKPEGAQTAVRNIADIGAGYGPISLALAHRNPRATVWAIEINSRARRLCQLNADAAGLRNVNVVEPDDVPSNVVFDEVWSNPPIRIGKATLQQLLLRWLRRLSPDGSAHLVVQKHLGADSLARWLATEGFTVNRYRSQKAYRLLQVRAAE